MVMLGRSLFGSKDKLSTFQNLSPEQMGAIRSLFQSLLGQEGGAFGDIFGPFNPQESADVFQQGVVNPSLMNFQQQIIPQIMQSFADQGASSGLNQSLATAGRNLQQNLSSQLANFVFQNQQQNRQNRIAGLGLGLGTQMQQPVVNKGSAGIVPSLLNNFASGLGKSIGFGLLG